MNEYDLQLWTLAGISSIGVIGAVAMEAYNGYKMKKTITNLDRLSREAQIELDTGAQKLKSLINKLK